jgi:ABC-type branched-subunit amino acid transport system ATPase component
MSMESRITALPAPALRVEELQVRFGGVVAVADLSFEVPRGQLLGVIGANGAGKTTMFDAVCGAIPHSGRVLLDGRDIGHLPASLRARAGLGRSFQDARLFPALSVRDTVVMALQRDLPDPGMTAELLAWPAARRAERSLRLRAGDIIETFGLEPWADAFIADLSTGTRRIVDLACVYALRPSVILLDEPASGIAQREVEALGEVILRLRDMAAATVLVVEHDVPLVRRIAERVMVMESGRLIADGEPEEVLELPEVIASYLGTDQGALRRSGAALPAAAALVEVRDEDGQNDGSPEVVAVRGLPERDSFRIPVRLTGAGGLAAAAAVLLAAVLQTATAQPPARAAARHSAPHTALAQTTPPPTTAPRPSTAPAAVAPLPPLVPPSVTPLLGPVDQVFVGTVTPPSSPPPSPPASPTPTPCPVQQLSAVCDLLGSVPVPVPLSPPLAAGMAWARAGDGPWVQLPAGWRAAAWGAAPRGAPSASGGTLIAWTGSGATDPALGEVAVSWWTSASVLRQAFVAAPTTLPGGQLEWSQVSCDGSRCVLAVAVSGSGGAAGPGMVEVAAGSVRW